MRNALGLALLSGLVLAITASCAHQDQRMQPNPGQGYVLETTGAPIGRDDPQSRNEPDPTLGEVARRLAGQICEREVRCHGSSADMGPCMRTYVNLSALEVATWGCSPAATRSRAKECIASLNAEPCEMDISTKPELCPASATCPDATATLASPGAVAAKTGGLGRASGPPSFDRRAAATVLAAVDVSSCRGLEGPSGPSHITVTFAPDGGVLTSALDRGPDGSAADLEGTPKGQCVIEQFRKARIPLFEGQPVMVGVAVGAE